MKKTLFGFALIGVFMLAGCGATPSSSTVAPQSNGTSETQTNGTPPSAETNNSTAAQTSTQTTGATSETKPTTTGPKTYSMADVAAANTAANCLTVINGNVYNLTDWIDKHPGGDRAILSICGIDGSSAYNRQHGGQSRPESILAGYKVGVLK